jgi:hypothetical protein
MERANHSRIALIISDKFPKGTVKLPRLNLKTENYHTESFDTSRPLWKEQVWAILNPESRALYTMVLRETILTLAKYEFFLRDVEVYIQSDGTLVLSNFSVVHYNSPNKLKLESATMVPVSVVPDLFPVENVSESLNKTINSLTTDRDALLIKIEDLQKRVDKANARLHDTIMVVKGSAAVGVGMVVALFGLLSLLR